MQFSSVVVLACLAWPAMVLFAVSSALPYDDDDTPRKVELSDLEVEQEQRQQLRQQQLPYYSYTTARKQQQQQQQQQPLRQYKNHHAHYTEATRAFSFRQRPTDQQEAAAPSSTPTAPSAAAHSPLPTPTAAAAAATGSTATGADGQYDSLENVQQIVYNDISAATIAAREQELAGADVYPVAGPLSLPPGVLPLTVQHALLRQRAQQQQQLQQQLLLEQQRSAYVLLPPPYDTEEADADTGVNSAERQQQQQQHALQLHLQQQQQQQQLPSSHFSHVPSSYGARPPAIPSPTLPSYAAHNENEIDEAIQRRPSVASAAGVNVHYVTSNHLDNGQPDDVFLAHADQRPVIVYGGPPVPRALPSPPPPPPGLSAGGRAELAHLLAHSKQYAFAPARGEEAQLSPHSATIPYPPSFISITSTTARPDIAASRSNAYARYSRPFRPSQVDPLPDLFSNRQSKSLLDSYIPSWVIAQMIQQQQQQQQQQHYRPLTYTSAIPYRRQFKRHSANEVPSQQQQQQPQQRPAKSNARQKVTAKGH